MQSRELAPDERITKVLAKLAATDLSVQENFKSPDEIIAKIIMTQTEQPREPLLNERQKTHGSFKDNARISQTLKATLYTNGADKLEDVHKEALDMIALKLSRILSGQAMVKDHWDDIAGYAKLGAEICNR